MPKPVPDWFHTITPHITVSDAAKAIDFYRKAFEAREIDKHLAPDGKTAMHAGAV